MAASAPTLAAPLPGGLGERAARGRAWLVGGGIAGLAAATFLVRDGKMPGQHIHVLEEDRLGGSLDASGSAAHGYSMRGSRMLGPAYTLTYDLLAGIPSLDDPGKSVAEEIYDVWQTSAWHDHARLVDDGRIVDVSTLGLSNRDRVALIRMMLQTEQSLGASRIDAHFEPAFLDTSFALMWCSMFGFEPWHSAAEFRRYLLRFLRLLPGLATMEIIQTTRFNGFDSIVRPLLRWLGQQGVQFGTGVQVTDLDFTPAGGGHRAVQRLHTVQAGQRRDIDVGPGDLVIVTNGSMTTDASLGSMDTAPPRRSGRQGGAWPLWQRLAEQEPVFGRPSAFCGHVEQTEWITFTVTDSNARFFERMERFGGSPAGCGGLVTLSRSNWRLTFHLYPTPAYAAQPPGVFVWWGYGLFPHALGNHVHKPMHECSGREILVELYAHLGFQDEADALLASANCIPCLLPYTTSQFMPRAAGDRPDVVPAGYDNLAFVGQYCEVPDDTVYTVEYSVHSARLAVTALLGLTQPIPPTYQGQRHTRALVDAMRIIVRAGAAGQA